MSCGFPAGGERGLAYGTGASQGSPPGAGCLCEAAQNPLLMRV